MTAQESAIMFQCSGSRLCGVLHHPSRPERIGVVIVVGGPQYRVGSHRQFVLLARQLAGHGYASLRFDYRGMGDSEGAFVGFEGIGDDIRSAVDTLIEHEPSIREVAIWGLCDAASAGSFYGSTDSRVSRLILVNPWVRSEVGEARAYLRHYYLRRLASRELWAKIVAGRFDLKGSVRSLIRMVANARGGREGALDSSENAAETESHASRSIDTTPSPDLAARVRRGLEEFEGRVLVILSGKDLTAAEFRDAARDRRWRRLLSRRQLTLRHLDEADHTFSRREWQEQVSSWTAEWLDSR